ncbi:MAG TPA: hypothetical protein VLM19_04720, partial [Nitrospiraceae bacterium]|nr:hypothetical protein [Nitrospiraceae bacterium]
PIEFQSRIHQGKREEGDLAGCSKRPSSKAAASEEARRTPLYVESLSEVRTPLADFFSILLEARSPFENSIRIQPVSFALPRMTRNCQKAKGL